LLLLTLLVVCFTGHGELFLDLTDSHCTVFVNTYLISQCTALMANKRRDRLAEKSPCIRVTENLLFWLTVYRPLARTQCVGAETSSGGRERNKANCVSFQGL